MKMELKVEHDGVEYTGIIGTIKSTMLGVEDHGIMTSFLHVEWKGGGIGVGGYSLDTPRKDENDKHIGRFGSAFGLDHILRTIETVGVDNWEDLQGEDVVVLFDYENHGWGSSAVGIAGIRNKKAFIFKDHALNWSAPAEDKTK